MSDTTNNLRALAALLRSRRKALGLTQEDVADLCGVRRQTVGRVENADPSVAIGTVMAVADVLGFDISSLDGTPQ